MSDWTLDDIPWNSFDQDRVDPKILKLVKAACMVEFNGGDYAAYLCNVFPDDPQFQAEAHAWAAEEMRHGRALGRWAEMADPEFNFEQAFERFIAGFRPDVEAKESIRGSRSGELVARCIVEVGTSSYYAALGEAAVEPVLKDICKRITADELRHYRMFYKALKRYLEREGIGPIRRVMVALGRIKESEDDELAYAYYAANADPRDGYDLKRYTALMQTQAWSYFRERHIARAVTMTAKAAGLNPQAAWLAWLSRMLYGWVQRRGMRPLPAG